MVYRTTEVPTLYPEIELAPTPPGRGEHAYYRKADGWIVTAPCWPSFRADMEFKGARMLPGYGTFVYDLGPKNKDARGAPWDVVQEPWRKIFQLNGAKEFPVAQIIAYHWHLSPPYREVIFPQLDDVTIYDFHCPECDKGLFSSMNENEAIDMLRRHLTGAVDELHKYRVQDLNELGKEWGISFDTRRIGRRHVRVVVPGEERVISLEEEAAIPTLEPAGPMKNLAFQCQWCDWAPLTTNKMAMNAKRFHERRCKARPEATK